MLTEAQARQRIQSMQNQGEKRVGTLLVNFGLEAVDFNAIIRGEDGQEIVAS